ncbi:MAG: hypothetical protein IPG34_10810 [Rhodocyclaceae bacterium]|nr:hypothetical protein [Rhodocyclaceae bacterium]
MFADGTVLSLAELLARGFDIAGEGELNGTALRDRIAGGAGADVFNGGRGDDQLLGGAGDDTYHYRLGDGVDQIVDSQGGPHRVWRRHLGGGCGGFACERARHTDTVSHRQSELRGEHGRRLRDRAYRVCRW